MDYLTRFFLELEQLLAREGDGLTLPAPLSRREGKTEKERRILTKTEELTHRLETALHIQQAVLPQETVKKQVPAAQWPRPAAAEQESFFSRPAAAPHSEAFTPEGFSRFFERDARRYGKGD